MLSKTTSLWGLQCHKRLWLGRNAPGESAPIDESQQVIFATGHGRAFSGLWGLRRMGQSRP